MNEKLRETTKQTIGSGKNWLVDQDWRKAQRINLRKGGQGEHKQFTAEQAITRTGKEQRQDEAQRKVFTKIKQGEQITETQKGHTHTNTQKEKERQTRKVPKTQIRIKIKLELKLKKKKNYEN